MTDTTSSAHNKIRELKWHCRFLNLARTYAQYSKDPSTKVGAIIVRTNRTIASTGYNGFPRGVGDSEEFLNNREERLIRTIHAEANAIVSSSENLTGMTLYCTHTPCASCAGLIIQAGITRVIADYDPDYYSRWEKDCVTSNTMFIEADVDFFTINTLQET